VSPRASSPNTVKTEQNPPPGKYTCWLVKKVLEFHRDNVESRQEPVVVVGRKGCEQTIRVRRPGGWRRPPTPPISPAAAGSPGR
jgi:hypothetical protein